MSISRPQKKPTHSPSFLPRIKPKDDTAIINRFGEILAKERVLNSVVCNKKHKVIIINKTILRLMLLLTYFQLNF